MSDIAIRVEKLGKRYRVGQFVYVRNSRRPVYLEPNMISGFGSWVAVQDMCALDPTYHVRTLNMLPAYFGLSRESLARGALLFLLFDLDYLFNV